MGIPPPPRPILAYNGGMKAGIEEKQQFYRPWPLLSLLTSICKTNKIQMLSLLAWNGMENGEIWNCNKETWMSSDVRPNNQKWENNKKQDWILSMADGFPSQEFRVIFKFMWENN